MNLITEPLRQLVRRKLWPVALLLVGGLVAVPLTLAKAPEPTVPPPAPRAADGEGVPATFVSLAGDGEGEGAERRRVLGEEKDPFEPRTLPKAKKKSKAKPARDADAKPAESAPAEEPKGGGGGGGGASAPAFEPPVAATPTATPKPQEPKSSVKVRFGTSDAEELETATLERMAPLPSEKDPLIVFMGFEDKGKTAVFMLTGEVTAQGDGECLPTPEDCQTLKLRKGETEFFDVAVEDAEEPVQYQLDLVKLHR